MNKGAWIFVVVVIVMLGLFIYFSKSNSAENMPNENESVSQEVKNAVIKTSMGDIGVELYTGLAPVTAGNFIKLASGDFYDNVKFHRVIEGFMIQTGDPNSKDDSKQGLWGTGGPGYAIADEFAPTLSNTIGTLSMANSGPHTGGSQFFINTADNTFLDRKHAVFGKVTSGLDVAVAISVVERSANDVPVTPVIITDIVIE